MRTTWSPASWPAPWVWSEQSPWSARLPIGTIYDLLGIDQAISPRILCANSILRFVRSGSPSAIAVVGEGMAEVLELTVKRQDSIKIEDLGMPKGTVIGARVRDDAVIVPTGKATIQGGDSVIVFTLPEHLDAVQKLFTGKAH